MRSVVDDVKSLGRPTVFLVVPVVTLLFCFAGVLVHVLMEARKAALERAVETATGLIAVLSTDIARNIEIINLSLQEVVDTLGDPGIDRIDPELRRRLLFDRSATARHLGRIVVTDEWGDLQIDSRAPSPQPRNFAERDYFQAHRENNTVGTYIGRPERARDSGEWFIGISRRLSHTDGSFAGVVVAALRLSFFEELFKAAPVGRNGNVTVARSDGILIMQWSSKETFIGLDLGRTPLFEHFAESPFGIFEKESATDAVRRLVAYDRVGDLPLVVSVGRSIDHVYANWRRSSRPVIVLVSILCVVTVLLALYLARELIRRESAERELALLAMADGLTGLLNRGYFDQMVERGWRSCRRARLPAGVLMIDVDRFRLYNEVNGRRTGDALLKALGRSLSGALKRATDWAGHYGADTFPIFLSGASEKEAQSVARLLRQRFAQECLKDGIPAASLSIGIATAVPKGGEAPDQLLESADHALALAKQRGRGRTEVGCASRDQIEAA